MEQSLQTRHHRSDTYSEKNTDEDSDDELFPAQETSMRTSRATRMVHHRDVRPGALRAFIRASTWSPLRSRILTTATTRRSIWAILKRVDAPLAVRLRLGRTSGVRYSSGRQPSIALRHIAVDAYLTPTRPSGGVFGITSNTLARSSQRPCMGRYGGAPTSVGWGGLLDRAADTIAAWARSESLLRYSDVSTHMHMSHAESVQG